MPLAPSWRLSSVHGGWAAEGSLERAVLGLLAPARLLDYVENFVVFHRETQRLEE